jgi:hypothetical protein
MIIVTCSFVYGTQIFGSTECGIFIGIMSLVTLPYLTLPEQDGRQMVLRQYGLHGKSVRKISSYPYLIFLIVILYGDLIYIK